jgi:hypothetical protein
MVYVPTAAGIISGKNNEHTTVVMTCICIAVKHGLDSLDG